MKDADAKRYQLRGNRNTVHIAGFDEITRGDMNYAVSPCGALSRGLYLDHGTSSDDAAEILDAARHDYRGRNLCKNCERAAVRTIEQQQADAERPADADQRDTGWTVDAYAIAGEVAPGMVVLAEARDGNLDDDGRPATLAWEVADVEPAGRPAARAGATAGPAPRRLHLVAVCDSAGLPHNDTQTLECHPEHVLPKASPRIDYRPAPSPDAFGVFDLEPCRVVELKRGDTVYLTDLHQQGYSGPLGALDNGQAWRVSDVFPLHGEAEGWFSAPVVLVPVCRLDGSRPRAGGALVYRRRAEHKVFRCQARPAPPPAS